ncbi:sugar ABC transporter ATP-binding protein [uncultured Gulosibacter sp.]|uniref:sugar ABC transporter ATP-binding protein n=1 Tax=uncultured Gulosibacter sp. TaxID=1339167 RepID=UPI00288C0E7A|nr:sugar ABC transporter ATP-binding protein [uncultured Gulosibacter sp.]
MLDPDSILFSTRGLEKRHGSKNALIDINLDIGRGEIIGLVGQNGAGKSTLLNVIGGAYGADAGTMTLDGDPYNPDSREAALAAGVSSIPQDFTVDPDLTVADEIFATSFQATASYEDRVQLAQELLRADGIDIDATARLGDLARAEQVCVRLLRLSFEESQLLLLDEITAVSNDLEISVLHTITNRLTKQGRSGIYISHRLDEVQSLSDRIVVMREGRIFAELEPSESGGAAGIAYAIFMREFAPVERPPQLQNPQPLLQIENLTADGVKPISLTVHRGEVLGVTGMRRSGHSELGAAIGGINVATSGVLRLNGQELSIQSPQDATANGIAYLHDEDDARGITKDDTMASATMQPMEGASFAEEARRFREVVATMQRLDISAIGPHESVGNLSGGDQQKVALAKWLQIDAEVVVLNHPTRGVDAASREVVYEMINEITARGGGVVLISSDMTEVLDHSNRVAIMRDGELVDIYPNTGLTEDMLVMIALGSQWKSGTTGRRAAAPNDHNS